MSAKDNSRSTLYFLTALLIAGSLVFSTFLFFDQLVRSAQLSFHVDEHFGLKHSVRSYSGQEMIVKGTIGQGSASPLFYLIWKGIDEIRHTVRYWGLMPKIYYRLFSLMILIAGVLFVELLFIRKIWKEETSDLIKSLRLALLFFVPFMLLFTRENYFWTVQARPYTMWNSLWMAALAAGLLGKRYERLLGALLVILSLTATASVFQIAMMAGAYFIVLCFMKEPWGRAAGRTLGLFAVPEAINVYYIFHGQEWTHPYLERYWTEFSAFWLRNLALGGLLMAAAGALCWFRKENRPYLFVPLTVIFLYLIGPMIFLLTKWNHFFYDERQYIYYNLTPAVFLLTVVCCLPAYEREFSRWKIPLAAGLIAAALCFSGAGESFANFRTAVGNTVHFRSHLSLIRIGDSDVSYWDNNELWWHQKTMAGQYFYDDGTLRGEATFKEGAIDGVAREYYKSGNLKMQAEYKEGKKHGRSQYFYDEKGKIARDDLYNDDQLLSSKTYDPQGRLISQKE